MADGKGRVVRGTEPVLDRRLRGTRRAAPAPSDDEYFVNGEDQDSVKVRAEYLQTALQSSEEGDSAVYLANPRVVTPEGEAWFFANWLSGATRYGTFREMVQNERESSLRLM